MTARLSRQELYELVWDRPRTQLAEEFGLSDVALGKICRKFRVPTPPVGYWAKKAHGKPTATMPLPEPDDTTEILIRESTASNEPQAIAEARVAIISALEATGESDETANAIVERTLAKLGHTKRGGDGMARIEARGLAKVCVRPETVDRTGAVLRQFVATGERAGLALVNVEDAVAWHCEGETIGFELIEVPDQVKHVATQKELDAVARWKREREERHRRFGYWRDWGEPKIPKWEQRYQGRLAIKLEEVRLKSERTWWGEPMQRTFSDTRTRDVARAIPRVIGAVAAMAAAKKANREFEERKRAEDDEAARQRQAAERQRLLDERASALLEQLLDENEYVARLKGLILTLRDTGSSGGARFGRLLRWAELRLEQKSNRLKPATIEERLSEAGAFEDESGTIHD
jgi:hypothetical protein